MQPCPPAAPLRPLSFLLLLCLAWGLRAQGPALTPPQRVSKSVWMLETPPGPDVGGNLAIVDRGDHLLLVDAAMPRTAAFAAAWIAKELRKPVRYLVLSHAHLDHVYGSGAFPAARILAHEDTVKLLRRPSVLAGYRARASQDEAFQRFAMRLPEISVARRLVLAEASPRVEILHWGAGHSPGDLLVWIPEEKVLCGGDLLAFGSRMPLDQGDPSNWIDILGRIRELGPDKLIPGHGSLLGIKNVAAQQRYLRALLDLVRGAQSRGESLAQLRPKLVASDWRPLLGQDAPHERHLRQLYAKELSRRRGGGQASERGGRVAVDMSQGLRKLRFLHDRKSPDLIARARQLAPNVELVYAANRAEARRLAPSVHGAVAHLCDAEFLAAATQLRWLQSMSAGVERYLRQPGIRSKEALVLTNMKGMHGPAIADHVFAMTLHLWRGLDTFRRQMRAGSWQRQGVGRVKELRGKNLLVVGLGGIGMEVARRGKGFGMHVLATRRSRRPRPAGVDEVGVAADLDRFLAVADLVVLCVPLTAETKGLFDAARLSKMKRGATLINIARGKVVDTDALCAALRSGQLAAAGLDVTDPEPLPAGHPLFKMPQVLVTPHVAGWTDGTTRRVLGLLLANLQRFGQGEPLLNVVDKRRGY